MPRDCLYILIDSSTRRSSRTSKYGPSTACWCAFWNDLSNLPCRVGIVYSPHEGPNKMFYDGLIRALEDCFHLVHADACVKVLGDNELVIKQLRKEQTVKEMTPFYNQVKKIESKYRGVISYEHLNEKSAIYKKVDEVAKQFRHVLKAKFRIGNTKKER